MVAKDRSASDHGQQERIFTQRTERLTHSRNNLGFHSKLALKSTCKVGDATLSVSCHIRDFSNVVEHVTGSEEEDEDETNSSP